MECGFCHIFCVDFDHILKNRRESVSLCAGEFYTIIMPKYGAVLRVVRALQTTQFRAMGLIISQAIWHPIVGKFWRGRTVWALWSQKIALQFYVRSLWRASNATVGAYNSSSLFVALALWLCIIKPTASRLVSVEIIHVTRRVDSSSSDRRRTLLVQATLPGLERAVEHESCGGRENFVWKLVKCAVCTDQFDHWQHLMTGRHAYQHVPVPTYTIFTYLLGPFHGAIAVPSVTRCRCRRRRRCCGHRCAGGVRL